MEPRDKFGKAIYGRTWSNITDFGARLLEAGYVESPAKPNLFSREVAATDPRTAARARDLGYPIIDEPASIICRFYADLRGTSEVPIWSDPTPLFYAFFNPDLSPWLQRRFWLEEVGRLVSRYGLRVRFSWYKTDELGGLFFDGFGDGDCMRCGVSFHDEGLYCTSCQCMVEKEQKEKRLIRCAACNAALDPWEEPPIRHHVRYFPEDVVIVHERCHANIHLQDQYPNLRPPPGEAEKFYSKRLATGLRTPQLGADADSFTRGPTAG